jgi:alpha-tubulin suppressor-like RCC1 family protein
MVAGAETSYGWLPSSPFPSVLAVGGNQNFELGDPSLAGQPLSASYRQVFFVGDVIQIAASASSACILKRDGTVWCWGSNTFGQVGDGGILQMATPTQVRF